MSSKHVGSTPGGVVEDRTDSGAGRSASPFDGLPEPSPSVMPEPLHPPEPGGSDGSGDSADPAGPSTEEMVGASSGPAPARAGREVTCPECGTVAKVTVNRRESQDFCAHCDFPLFWTPSQIVLDAADAAAQAALRRLPGAAGRRSLGSVTCPHCNEGNQLTAEICVRCGGDLHPAPRAIAPAPAPPPPPEPAPRRPVWPWVVGVLTLFLLVAVVAVLIWG